MIEEIRLWEKYRQETDAKLEEFIGDMKSQKDLEDAANLLAEYLGREDIKRHPMFEVIEMCLNYAIK